MNGLETLEKEHGTGASPEIIGEKKEKKELLKPTPEELLTLSQNYGDNFEDSTVVKDLRMKRLRIIADIASGVKLLAENGISEEEFNKRADKAIEDIDKIEKELFSLRRHYTTMKKLDNSPENPVSGFQEEGELRI